MNLFGNNGVNMISPMELKARMNEGENLFLLDVREPNELISGVGKIEGVTNISVGSLMNRLEEIHGYKDTEVIVVCHSGARANTGAKILKASGFSKVSVLSGGMLGWRREGL